MSHFEQMRFVAETKALHPEFFKGARVLEIGSLDINGSVRRFFEDCNYTGIDVAPGHGVDLVATAHEYDAPDGSFDVVISCEALEHDMHWKLTLAKCVELLRPGGLLLITCASGSRPEHGTRRNSPGDSGTSEIEGWCDYYRNLELGDLRGVVDLDSSFPGYVLRLVRGGQDLQFMGIKAGGPKRAEDDRIPCLQGSKVSVIIPVIRTEKARRCIEAVERTSNGWPIEIVSEEDTERIGCPKMVARLVAQSTGQLVAFLGDDTVPLLGWLTAALTAMATLPDDWGMVGLNDQHNDGNLLATHWLADKRLLPMLGGEFFHTGYRHTFCDNELITRCKALGRYVWAADALIEHDHPIVRGESMEGTDYEWAYRADNWYHDQRLFKRRQREGWK